MQLKLRMALATPDATKSLPGYSNTSMQLKARLATTTPACNYKSPTGYSNPSLQLKVRMAIATPAGNQLATKNSDGVINRLQSITHPIIPQLKIPAWLAKTLTNNNLSGW
jgi:hypothetical protein